MLGLNYVPAADALVALTSDGHIYALDRATGAPLLATPYVAPRRADADRAVEPAAGDRRRRRRRVPHPGQRAAGSLSTFTAALLGNGVRVANMFSVDPASSQLWVAATAPDGEDGTVDGVSQLGALFRLGLVAGTAGYQIQEVCHRSFTGGSASTPTVSADGSRVYLGDNTSLLLAIDANCADAWSVDVGAQIFGSVAASSDRHEIYTSSGLGITKVIDGGASATIAWTANLDVFDLAMGQQNLNMNLVAIGANGLAFQAGAGVVVNGTALPDIVGTGILDRESGAVRQFVAGGEETVAVMSTGPDGADLSRQLAGAPHLRPRHRPVHGAAGRRHHQVRLRRSAAPDARRRLRRRGAGPQRRRAERLRRRRPRRRRPDRRADRPGPRAVGAGDRRRHPRRHPVDPPRPPPHPRRALPRHRRRRPDRDPRPQARRQPHRPRLPQAEPPPLSRHRAHRDLCPPLCPRW